MDTTELIEIAELCDAQIHETVDMKGKRGPHFVVFLPQDLQQFAQRIEQPLQKRIAELEQELDYAKQAARVEADMCDQAMSGMKQLRDALLQVRQFMYINDYGDWALEEGFNGFDITPIDRALEQTK